MLLLFFKLRHHWMGSILISWVDSCQMFGKNDDSQHISLVICRAWMMCHKIESLLLQEHKSKWHTVQYSKPDFSACCRTIVRVRLFEKKMMLYRVTSSSCIIHTRWFVTGSRPHCQAKFIKHTTNISTWKMDDKLNFKKRKHNHFSQTICASFQLCNL